MIVLSLLIPLSIAIGLCFLAAFIWAVRSGQFEDTRTPSMRLLMDEPAPPPKAGPGSPDQPQVKT